MSKLQKEYARGADFKHSLFNELAKRHSAIKSSARFFRSLAAQKLARNPATWRSLLYVPGIFFLIGELPCKKC
jgi:hypothetical protein